MEKKYFKVGLRPVYYEEKDNESFVFVFDWTNRLLKMILVIIKIFFQVHTWMIPKK